MNLIVFEYYESLLCFLVKSKYYKELLTVHGKSHTNFLQNLPYIQFFLKAGTPALFNSIHISRRWVFLLVGLFFCLCVPFVIMTEPEKQGQIINLIRLQP